MSVWYRWCVRVLALQGCLISDNKTPWAVFFFKCPKLLFLLSFGLKNGRLSCQSLHKHCKVITQLFLSADNYLKQEAPPAENFFFRQWNCKPNSTGNPKVPTFTPELWPHSSFLTSVSYRPSVITTFHMDLRWGLLIRARAMWPPLRSVDGDSLSLIKLDLRSVQWSSMTSGCR